MQVFHPRTEITSGVTSYSGLKSQLTADSALCRGWWNIRTHLVPLFQLNRESLALPRVGAFCGSIFGQTPSPCGEVVEWENILPWLSWGLRFSHCAGKEGEGGLEGLPRSTDRRQGPTAVTRSGHVGLHEGLRLGGRCPGELARRGRAGQGEGVPGNAEGPAPGLSVWGSETLPDSAGLSGASSVGTRPVLTTAPHARSFQAPSQRRPGPR